MTAKSLFESGADYDWYALFKTDAIETFLRIRLYLTELS